MENSSNKSQLSRKFTNKSSNSDELSASSVDNLSVSQANEGAATGSTSEMPEIGKRALPSIDGYGVETFTGTATVSYPIEIPQIRGNLSFSVDLNYSSRTIDDLRLNVPGYKTAAYWDNMRCEDYVADGTGDGGGNTRSRECREYWDDEVYFYKNQLVGLGWSTNSSPSITIDPENEHEYMLALGGNNFRIKYHQQDGDKQFYTYPESQTKITRLKGGQWKVIDSAGTVYIFGSPDNRQGHLREPESVVSANTYNFNWAYTSDQDQDGNPTGHPYCWTQPTSWSLWKMSDVHGNTLEIDYEQDIDEVAVYGQYEVCKYTKSIRPMLVKYNYSEEQERYLSKISYEYFDHDFGMGAKNRLDAQNNRPEYNKLLEQAQKARKAKFLRKIVVQNDNHELYSYHFHYKPTIKNDLWYSADGYLLLTAVEKKGFQGKGEAKNQTFCYNSLTSDKSTEICQQTDTSAIKLANAQQKSNYKANNIYLTQAGNGYGGLVTYQYEESPKQPIVCANLKSNHFEPDRLYTRLCTSDPFEGNYQHLSKKLYVDFYRVKRIVANNDSTNQLGEFGKLKVTEYEYLGEAEGFANDFTHRDEHDRSKALGYQFLGYPTVRTKVFEPVSFAEANVVKKLYAHTEERIKLSLKKGNFSQNKQPKNEASCVMIDPRKGQVYLSKTLDQAGREIGATTQSLLVTRKQAGRWQILDSEESLINDCSPEQKDWGGLAVHRRETYSKLDGKESMVTQYFDFEQEPDIAKSFGNVIKSRNHGLLTDKKDDLITYTRYLAPTDFEVCGQDQTCQLNKFEQYKKLNLNNLPAASFVSNVDGDMNEISEPDRYNWSRTFYDGALAKTQVGSPLVKGLPTLKRSIQLGVSADELGRRQVLEERTAYNKYGLAVVSYSPEDKEGKLGGVPTVTNYDLLYHMYPVCIKRHLSQRTIDFNQIPTEDCQSRQGEYYATKIEYDGSVGLARGLISAVFDPNGAKTSQEYDEWGRVTKVYPADPDRVGQTLPAKEEAFYYDQSVPMRTRQLSFNTIKTAGGEQELQQTEDVFFDGFGQLIQKTTYNLEYDRLHDATYQPVAYALLSLHFNNAHGKQEKLYHNVKLEGTLAQVPAEPKLINASEYQPLLSTGSLTQTKYDFLQRPIEVFNQSGDLKTKQVYAYRGLLNHQIDTRGTLIELQEDGFGRTVSQTTYVCSAGFTRCDASNGQAVTTKFKYHPVLGSLTATIDPAGIEIETRDYANSGLLLRVTNLDRGQTKYYYDSLGRQIKTINGRGVGIEATYDDLDRPIETKTISTDGQLMRWENFTYDKKTLGQLFERKLYDKSVSQNHPLQSIEFEYDLAGKARQSLIKTLDLSQPAVVKGDTATYVEVKQKANYTKTGLLIGNQVEVSNSNFSSQPYLVEDSVLNYNRSGKLVESRDQVSGATYFDDVYYNDLGLVSTLILGNGLEENYQYDAFNRLTKKVLRKKGVEQYYNVNYLYENKQGLTSLLLSVIASDLVPDQRSAFVYDSLGRLTGTNNTSDFNKEYQAGYQFDILGNLLSKQEKSLTMPAESNAQTEYFSSLYGQSLEKPCENSEYKTVFDDKLTELGCPYHAPYKSKQQDTVTDYYGYNKTGSLVLERKVSDTDSKTLVEREFVYSVLDLPVMIKYSEQGKTSEVAKYYYGIDGQRIAKLVEIEKPSVQSDSPLASLLLTQQQAQKPYAHIYIGDYEYKTDGVYTETKYGDAGPNKVVKQRTKDGQWKAVFYVTDHLGSTSLAFSTEGSPVGSGQARYFPYGALITPTNFKLLPTMDAYTGQKLDNESGLLFYNSRLYNPHLGVFLQADRSQDGLNSYMYVKGNPILANDPDGQILNIAAGLASGFVGGLGGFIVDSVVQLVTVGPENYDFTRAVVNGVATGVATGCTVTTAGVGLTVCLAAAGTITAAYNTTQNIEAGMAPTEAVVAAVVEEGLSFGVLKVAKPVANLLVPQSVRREVVRRGSEAVGPVASRVRTYVSNSGQRLIMDPADRSTRTYLDRLHASVDSARRRNPYLSRGAAIPEYITDTIRYSKLERQKLYGRSGTASLGDVVSNRFGVCREMAALCHLALSEQEVKSRMVVGDIHGGRHAWVEYVDTVTGGIKVADPAQSIFGETQEAAYKIYRTVKNREYYNFFSAQ